MSSASILQSSGSHKNKKGGGGLVIRKVTFDEREEGEGIMRQIEMPSSDITWMTMRYGYTRGPSNKLDLRRLVFDDFGGGDLSHVVDSLPDNEVCFAVYNYGKGQQRELEKERLAKHAEAKKWSSVMQGSKHAGQRLLKAIWADWLLGMEIGMAAKESERLRSMAQELDFVSPPGRQSDFPMEQIQLLCSANDPLEKLLIQELEVDLEALLETEREEGHPSELLFRARLKVAQELENMVSAKRIGQEAEAAGKGSTKPRSASGAARRHSFSKGHSQSPDKVKMGTGGPRTGRSGSGPAKKGGSDKKEDGDKSVDSADRAKGGEGAGGGIDEEGEKKMGLSVFVGDDDLLDDEEAFQKQVEADAREMGLRMEKATMLMQRHARGWLARREQKRRGIKGWSLPQLAAARLKTILIVVWTPKAVPKEVCHAALFHIRYVVELLGKSSAVSDATVPHVVMKAAVREQLLGPAVAQVIAESYNLQGAEGAAGGVGGWQLTQDESEEDEDEDAEKPMFATYDEYISVVRRYNYLMQDKATQLLKDRRTGSSPRGERRREATRSGHGSHGMSATQAELYFEKHHYSELDARQGLKARTMYRGHKRAMEMSKQKVHQSKSEATTRGVRVGVELLDHAPEYRDIVFKHPPWWTLKFPAKWRGTSKDGMGTSADPDAEEERDEPWPKSSGAQSVDKAQKAQKAGSVAQLHYFRKERHLHTGLSSNAMKAVFSEKCREIGVHVLAEQEASFVSRSRKMFSFDPHSELPAVSIRDAGITPGAFSVLMNAICAEGVALSSLELSCNAIGDEGAACLADLLDRLPNLTSLDARSTSMGPRGQAGLFSAVASNTVLTCIDLGALGEAGRNVTGAEGALAIAQMLQVNSVLSSLSLSSNRISADQASEISRGLDQNICLRSLDLSDNDMRDIGTTAVSSSGSCKFLKVLSLAHNAITDKGMRAVVSLLETPDIYLENLNISGNVISAESATSIGITMCRNTSVTTLALDGNKLRADGGKGLSESLVWRIVEEKDPFGRVLDSTLFYPQSLVRLKLSRNELGNEGATRVASMLAQNTTLLMLDLSHNSITDAGASAMGDALSKNSSVENLTLAYNNIGDRGMIHLATALDDNNSLSHLNIEGNKFSVGGSRALIRYLPVASNLTDLRIDSNDVNYDHFEMITGIVGKHRKAFEGGVKTRLQVEINRLEEIVANAEPLAAKLAAEKRLLYRSTMEVDETKLKRMQDKRERSQVVQKANASKRALNYRSQQAEEGIADAEAALEQAQKDRAHALYDLDWRKEQGILQRDRLRRTLTTQLRTIHDENEDDKRWTKNLTEETLAVVERAILVKAEWRQSMVRMTEFLGHNADIPGMNVQSNFFMAQELVDEAMSRKADDGLLLKDHELKAILINLQKSDKKSMRIDLQKIGKRFGKLNINLTSALKEAKEHAEMQQIDAEEEAAEEAKAAAVKEERASKRHQIRKSLVSLDFDSDDDDDESEGEENVVENLQPIVLAGRAFFEAPSLKQLSDETEEGAVQTLKKKKSRKSGRRASVAKRRLSAVVASMSTLMKLKETSTSLNDRSVVDDPYNIIVSSTKSPKSSKILTKKKTLKSRQSVLEPDARFSSLKPTGSKESVSSRKTDSSPMPMLTMGKSRTSEKNKQLPESQE